MTHQSDQENAAIREAARLLHAADSLIITACAGMSIDSGLPDFRGEQGFWKAYPALGKQQTDFREIASPCAFRTHPTLAWGFYGHRLALYRSTIPHAGFSILKRWCDKMQHGYGLFTSNIDGQFQRAGFNPMTLHECHGSIHYLQCSEPCSDAIWPAASFLTEVDDATCHLTNDLPRCVHCGALARPNVLMFNDTGWCEACADLQSALASRWLDRVAQPLVIEIGAGISIPSVWRFGEYIVQQHCAKLIRINPREVSVNPAYGIGIARGGLAALQAIEDAWRQDNGMP